MNEEVRIVHDASGIFVVSRVLVKYSDDEREICECKDYRNAELIAELLRKFYAERITDA